MMDEIERLAKAGFALHWLHPKTKRPIGDDWAQRPVATLAALKKTYRAGNNLGVRLGKWSAVGPGFLHVFDLDVRKADLADEAFETLVGLFPRINFSHVPTVKSGSGGASRHFYVISDEPFASKKLAHSEGFTLVYDEKKKRDTKHWDWEIELFGTGKQVVLPPSIHPDTGKPYRWLRHFDFDDLDLGIGPIVDSADIRRLVNPDDDDDDSPEKSQPLGLSSDEIKEILDELPIDDYCDDRDGWLQVGMALHHETGGSKEGFEHWCAFSEQSEKFDLADQRRVWRSFKDTKTKLTRMASLIAVVREARLNDAIDDLTDDLEAGDLDDDIPAKKPRKQPKYAGDDELFGESDEQTDDDDEDEEFVMPPKREIKLRKEKIEKALGKPIPVRVQRLNAKHAVARVSSKTVIMDFHPDGSVSYGSVGDLHAYYENDRVATENATEPVTKAWMRHWGRRQYPNGIVFAPNEVVEGAYNHWQGFSVEPDPNASCKRILNHIRTIVCDGVQENFDYLIGWLAHMIQRADDKPGVAVVLRGRKGAGKDTVADYVGRLFPHHHVIISNKEHLVGRFNAHQEKCLLLHVEEGYWAGNKNDEGPLKFLITSEKVTIEPKGVNPFTVKSVLRMFMSSNEDWVVPATEDERRYFVLNVRDDYSIKGAKASQRSAYFTAIRKERDNGGLGALLHYLQNYDISNFDVREVPQTAALAEQKIHGLRNFLRFWYDILQSGKIDGSVEVNDLDDDSGEDTTNAWSAGRLRIGANDLRDSYREFMRTRRFDGEELRDFEIGKKLKLLAPGMERVRVRHDGVPNWVYDLPPLRVCRKQFEMWIGGGIAWEEV